MIHNLPRDCELVGASAVVDHDLIRIGWIDAELHVCAVCTRRHLNMRQDRAIRNFTEDQIARRGLTFVHINRPHGGRTHRCRTRHKDHLRQIELDGEIARWDRVGCTEFFALCKARLSDVLPTRKARIGVRAHNAASAAAEARSTGVHRVVAPAIFKHLTQRRHSEVAYLIHLYQNFARRQ